jgi:Ribosome associated membrane protein RAMP4
MQAQTPAQKRANAKFAKSEEKRMGKAEAGGAGAGGRKKNEKMKAPISRGWIGMLFFLFYL